MSHADDIAGYFGACPVCGRGGRLRHIGRDHWFYCKEHKVKWWGGGRDKLIPSLFMSAIRLRYLRSRPVILRCAP